jgi:hypothetical protein
MPSGVYERTEEHLKNMKIGLNKPDVIEKNRQRAIEQWKSGSFDEDVKKRSERMKGNQYSKGYKHTEEHKDKCRLANSGTNSSSYKDGRTLEKHYCIDCGKEVKNYTAKRCANCNSKFMWNNPEYRENNKTNLGNHHTEETKKKLKHGLDRHHIYLDGDDNKILMLTGSKHKSLHSRAYDYLVEIEKIDDYIIWFDKNYKLIEKEK